MARLTTLDLYKQLILPCLVGGPKSLSQLGVPRYALQALEREGLIYMRTCAFRTTTAKWGIQFWYRSDQEPPQRLDCATMTFEGMA
jgi:hypothetical protein